jgi:hypothetical protein
MNIYLVWTGTILYWIVWPVGIALYYLFVTVVAILKLIYWPIAFVLQPVVYLVRFIAACLALPFRALVKLEVSNSSHELMVHTSDCSSTASVQLCGRCGTSRPPRRTRFVLHLQHLPSPPPSRRNARAHQRANFQTIPPRESSAKGKVASYHATTRQCRHRFHQWLQQYSRQRWPSQLARHNYNGRNGFGLLSLLMSSKQAASSA